MSIESVMISIMFGAMIGYWIKQDPRKVCMIQQCRWISQKEWDEV